MSVINTKVDELKIGRTLFYIILQLDKLVDKQRETHRRMLEQLLMVEQSHKQALYKLENEKRNHGEFMKKSDEFTNLLEQERERLVHPKVDTRSKSNKSVWPSTQTVAFGPPTVQIQEAERQHDILKVGH